MNNFTKKAEFNSLQEIIDYLDNFTPVEESLDDFSSQNVIKFNGNVLEVLKLIKKYGLHFKLERTILTYSSFKRFHQETPNTYSVGNPSMYGHTPYKLNIKGYHIDITQNPRTNYERSYASKLADCLKQDDKYVILDIETTGLDPLLDDIIQICIYENEENYISRYLPLEKKENNTAYDINYIENDLLQKQKPITQEDVDKAIEKFDLQNKTVVIWTGSNYFDRTFLEAYFYQHNLKGIEKIKFYNAKDLLKLVENCYLQNESKDSIASMYGIDTTDSHNALADCKIQYLIVENLLNQNYAPLINNKNYKNLLYKIEKFFLYNNSDLTAEELYENLCNQLLIKNGKVFEDYDKNPRTRGKEWIDIHHIDEKVLPNIAVLTNQAKLNQNMVELGILAPYNKKERLVYATKVEHFLLHSLLSLINDISVGAHLLFGCLLKMEIGVFEKTSLEYKIQENRQKNFYSAIDFDSLLSIYQKVLSIQELNPSSVEHFYKIDTYIYDKNEYKLVMEKLTD